MGTCLFDYTELPIPLRFGKGSNNRIRVSILQVFSHIDYMPSPGRCASLDLSR